MMSLHENPQLFSEIALAAERPTTDGGLGIKALFIEKDYWITRSLQLLSASDPNRRAIFKGGTSLSKVYGIGARFSEDIDIAVADAGTMSDGQLKKFISRTAHNMTVGLEEIYLAGRTRKSSVYRKAFYRYPRIITASEHEAVIPGQILLEINSFANPYPHKLQTIQSFVTDFLLRNNANDVIKAYGLEPFDIPVLDKCRTLTEKLVSLLRCSLANEHIGQLSAKIRHFYDLHFLLRDPAVSRYVETDEFMHDLTSLFDEDQQRFAKPEGWQGRTIGESPLLTSLDEVWRQLAPIYLRELPGLAYHQIPTANEVAESLRAILKRIKL